MAKTPKFAPPKTARADLPQHFFAKWVPDTRPVRTTPCDHPGCEGVGEYRAPARHYRDEIKIAPLNIIDEKKEQVNRWFCLDHVKQYNASWDYYQGLSDKEMEEAIRSDMVWNRPSWRFGQWGPGGKKSAQAPHPAHAAFEDEAPREEPSEASAALMLEAAHAALAELGLKPPVEFEAVKKRYRELVKRHHPDMKADDETHSGDDTIRRLNAAFTLLKGFYRRKKT